jgi:hypothetical protein
VKLLVSFAPNYRVIDRRSEVNKCALMVMGDSDGDMCSEGDIYVL